MASELSSFFIIVDLLLILDFAFSINEDEVEILTSEAEKAD
jgi:hypothetical protein